ncbi:MAG: glycoside hydrolase family 99-like domain-containing protein [Paludibacteraceae bacterium]|nr:glycoside hydrolase family 99-like domain-containing protein [Paludibacteraceae bacterium]
MTSDQKQPKARVLAYYLPQFHPIPENDAWWGKGFTEWTNVGKAKPLFPGHYQPHVPADLGYYDLRVPETREAQAQMAREAGVEGFVYWHYWFGNGKRLLERPFNEVLASGKPDFPFALAWANETWSGFAHGASNERPPLIEQTYPGDEDYIAHFNAVLPAFKDNRYITCEGKPIFVVYHANQLPNAQHYIDLWQQLAVKNGLNGIYFIAHEMDMWDEEKIKKVLQIRINEGFAAINLVNLHGRGTRYLPLWNRIVRWLFYKHSPFRILPDLRPYDISMFRTKYDDKEDFIPSVIPNWDHTPRTGLGGNLIYNSTPAKFKEAMKYAVDIVQTKPLDKRFVFIKSWNEWAEGNYVEPDLRFGHQYLEAIRKSLE